MKPSAAAAKNGFQGARLVKFAIQAPLIPRLKKATGRMQQEEDATAAIRPAAAASAGARSASRATKIRCKFSPALLLASALAASSMPVLPFFTLRIAALG